MRKGPARVTADAGQEGVLKEYKSPQYSCFYLLDKSKTKQSTRNSPARLVL